MATAYAEIPMPPKWPVIGHTYQYLTNPIYYVLDAHDRYGDMVRYDIAWEKTLVLYGPDAVQFVLSDKTKAFSSRLGWQFRIEEFFKHGLMLRDFEDHRFHRGIMQSAFNKKALAGYLDIINETIQARLPAWESSEQFLFYPNFKQLTLDIAATAFLGNKPGKEMEQVNAAFTDAVAAAMALVRFPVPGNAWYKGVRGRKFLLEFLARQIPVKRANPGSDLFSMLCIAKCEDGNILTDEEILDHMIFLMMAAHDTVTSAVTTLVYMLAKHQNWQDRVREEVRGLDEPVLAYDDLDRLVETDWCYNEALRLYPPVHLIPRRTTRDLEYKGFQIPANTQVGINIISNHRMKAWWSEPEKYDPLRFSPERSEHKAHKHLFSPYGAGPHTCIGMHFAGMLVKAFIHQFILKFKVEIKDGQRLKHNLVPIPKPTDGLPVRLKSLA